MKRVAIAVASAVSAVLLLLPGGSASAAPTFGPPTFKLFVRSCTAPGHTRTFTSYQRAYARASKIIEAGLESPGTLSQVTMNVRITPTFQWKLLDVALNCL